jgi:hypothetical protein
MLSYILIKRVLLASALVLSFESCSNAPSTGPVPPSSLMGHFAYSAHSTDGTLRATGIIDITRADSVIAGTCNIQRTDTLSNLSQEFQSQLSITQYGVEAGSYSIQGFIYKDDTFVILLRNVEIHGALVTGLIEGKRYFAGIGDILLPFGQFILQRAYNSNSFNGAP